MIEDTYRDDPDFFAEVDEFIAAQPEDGERIERITDKLPGTFHEVLVERRKRVIAELPTGAWNWSAVAASAAIAAGLMGLLFIFILVESQDGGGMTSAGVERNNAPKPRPGESEFVVAIKEDGIQVERIEPIPPVAPPDLGPVVVKVEEVLPVEDVGSWFLQRSRKGAVPEAGDREWARSDIDRFVLADFVERGEEPPADADRATLLRRISHDLTGLPPSPELVARFLHNPSPAAYGSVVDELMERWQFGEHWAARWLDLVGYQAVGDSWRYREYVIAALNADKPFDQFLREQLSGDLMLAGDRQQRAEWGIATGFLAMGDGAGAERQVDRVMDLFMGMSAPFARGDGLRKYPLNAADCDAMAGIFASTATARALPLQLDAKRHPPANLVEDERVKTESKRLRSLIASGERRLERAVRQGRPERVSRLRAEVADLTARLVGLHQSARDQIVSVGSTYLGVGERDRAVDVNGVPRGVPASLATEVSAPEIAERRSGRAELADWLTSPRHPLTARVVVNRVWRDLFGHGLVRGADEIGLPGQVPSHPELLDHLAVRFVEDGWSMKSLVRNLVTSRSYQLGGADAPLPLRDTPRELDGRELRDAVASVAGWLQPAAESDGRMFARSEFKPVDGLEDPRWYRSLYVTPEPVGDELVFQAAVSASERLLASLDSGGVEERVEQAFVATLGRAPSSDEWAWAVEMIGRAGEIETGGVLGSVARPDKMGEEAIYLESLLPRVTVQAAIDGDGVIAWALLYHALMSTEEFRQLR